MVWVVVAAPVEIAFRAFFCLGATCVGGPSVEERNDVLLKIGS